MPNELLKCDFCSSYEVSWCYPCKTFDSFVAKPKEGPVVVGSEGDWAACDTCHDLIEAEKWDELAQRSVDTFPQRIKANNVNLVKNYMKHLQRDQFAKNRTGPAKRLAEEGQ